MLIEVFLVLKELHMCKVYSLIHLHIIMYIIMIYWMAFLVKNIDTGILVCIYLAKQTNVQKLTHRHTQNSIT